MSQSSRTRRDFEREIKEFRNPKPVSLSDALASDDPIYEIGRRLAFCQPDSMTASESMFYAASAFLGDTLNGGLDQCLFNSTGDYFAEVRGFIAEYCQPQLLNLMIRIEQLFPGHVVPSDREERYSTLEGLTEAPGDPMGALTDEFYQMEADYRNGLLKLVENRRTDFVLQSTVGDTP